MYKSRYYKTNLLVYLNKHFGQKFKLYKNLFVIITKPKKTARNKKQIQNNIIIIITLNYKIRKKILLTIQIT